MGLEAIRLSHSQCMSQEMFEEAVDDLLRVQWAMAWLPPDSRYWDFNKEQRKLVYAERGRGIWEAEEDKISAAEFREEEDKKEAEDMQEQEEAQEKNWVSDSQEYEEEENAEEEE